MTEETRKRKRGKDTTVKKRLDALRERTIRMPEVHLSPEAFTEVEAMLRAGLAVNKTDLVRQALHEKFARWAEEKA